MKRKSVAFRKKLDDLHYHQMNGRIFRGMVKDSDEKCREIAAELREMKNPLKPDSLRNQQEQSPEDHQDERHVESQGDSE